jgi:hypothetical protein
MEVIAHNSRALTKRKDPCFELNKFTVLEELCFIRRLLSFEIVVVEISL